MRISLQALDFTRKQMEKSIWSVVFLFLGEKMSCCILDKLKFGTLGHKEPIKKEITIVKRR